MNEARTYFVSCTMALIVIASVLVVNDMSYEDEKRQAEHYCYMTAEGYWVPYKAGHEEMCE